MGTFLRPLPLEFSNFSKNCDFSIPIFHNFWRNCRNRSVCWAPFLYLLYHLNLVILANTVISLIFRKFLEKSQKLQKWQFLLGTLLLLLTLVLILAKTVISPIFRNFWRNHRNCGNHSFCWAPFYLF